MPIARRNSSSRACSTSWVSRLCNTRDPQTPQVHILQNATVRQALPNARYRVQLADGTEILAHVSGAARMQLIRILPGDKVSVEVSPFDGTKGRITLPNRDQPQQRTP